MRGDEVRSGLGAERRQRRLELLALGDVLSRALLKVRQRGGLRIDGGRAGAASLPAGNASARRCGHRQRQHEHARAQRWNFHLTSIRTSDNSRTTPSFISRLFREGSPKWRTHMMTRRAVAAWILVLCTWASPAFGQSQAINGTIEGTVKDDQGGVLPGVTVTITNTDTGRARVVVTNDTGRIRAPLLPLGTYKIEFAMTGFASSHEPGLTLAAGQTIVLNEALTGRRAGGGHGHRGFRRRSTSRKPTSAATSTEREIKNLPIVVAQSLQLRAARARRHRLRERRVRRAALRGQRPDDAHQLSGRRQHEHAEGSRRPAPACRCPKS